MSRADRVRAAVLKIIGGRELQEAYCRIDHVGDPIGFALMVEGICVATCDHPSLLSDHAFQCGAEGVTHNYHLRLAED